MALIFYWMIFKHLRQPGWYSLIPGFNAYVLFAIGWDAMFFWLYLLGMGCMMGAMCAAAPVGIILGYTMGMLLYFIMLIKIYKIIPDGKIWVILTIIFDVVLNYLSFIAYMVYFHTSGFFTQLQEMT